jgi:predicted RNA polymerase sigma factor
VKERLLPKAVKARRKKAIKRRIRRVRKMTAAERERVEGFIRLLDKWAADESGYDEETWPALKKALQANRSGYARKLFRD